jgi:hypothetical protein
MRYYHKTQSNTHLVTLALVALVGVAGYFAYDYMSAPKATAQSAVVPEETTGPVSPLSNEQMALLAKIEALKLDGTIFQDDAFKSLQDWTVELGTQPAGKTNPFAPLTGRPAAANTRR